MNEFQLDQIWEQKAFEQFLRNIVFQDNVVTPFKSYLNRHFLDGNRILNNSIAIERQASDKNIYEKLINVKLIRPEQGSTNIRTQDNAIVRYRSPLTRVFKDIIRGVRIATKLDYHSAQRFAAPIMIGNNFLYAHMECVPFRMLDEKGNVCDPRVRGFTKVACKPYRVDSRFVLTIEWPERNEALFLNNIIDSSPYPEDAVVNGRISWKDFVSHEMFSGIFQELKIEVMNENPKKHPVLGMGEFFTELNVTDFILPSSPINKDKQYKSSFSFQKFPSFSDVSKSNWVKTQA